MANDVYQKIVAFRIPEDLLALIQSRAECEDRTASYVVRQIVAKAFNYDLRKPRPTVVER